MGILKKIGSIIAGPAIPIFDKKDGSVRHNLGKKKWDEWQSRYLNGEEFNWRKHKGTKNSGLESK